jgi:hypothetical protein
MEVRHEDPGCFFTRPMAIEDAYLVIVHLRPLRSCEAWINGRSIGEFPVRADAMSVFHLANDFSMHVSESAHWLVARGGIRACNASMPALCAPG